VNKRDIAQAILLGLFYVQSCATTGPIPRPVSMKELPQPVAGPEKQRQRLEQLLTLSEQPNNESENKQTAVSRDGLRSMVGFGKLTVVGEPKCFRAGCMVDVVYKDVEELVKTDEALVNNLGSPYHRWYGEGGLGSNGRTPPRREDNGRIVATWYTLTAPTPARLDAFKKYGGYQ
jgi:hypothetical protein